MRLTRLEYPSGREVLRDYWGFLTSGGLLLADRSAAQTQGVEDGEPVLLDVHISSLRREFRVAGHLHRRDDGRALIVFDRGQQRDLLDAAWADGQGAPERRHRRLDVCDRVEVRYRLLDGDGVGWLVNVSRGGCCLEMAAPVRAGGRIVLAMAGLRVDGRVRWSRAHPSLAGVEFATFQESLVASIATTR